MQVYHKVVRPSLIYGSETWTLSDKNKSKVKAKEMRFLRRIKGITRRDRIRNTVVAEGLNIVLIEKVIEERQLSLLGHVHRINKERLAKEIFEVRVTEKNKVGRSHRRWTEEVRQTAEQRDITGERLEHWPRTEKHGREKLGIIGIHDKWLLNKHI